eukprot:GEZU01024602.1.p1 GENE.GEZU01024602.1~~GEZU01024602.1.p1  ORF type:complete len:262 (-),score=55.80 GEZU01024602.1:101-886(-)
MASFRKIPASSLYVSRPVHWLTSRFHFSFAEYWNPNNTNFGVLRVLNDDLVTPGEGFPTHPHRNAEIVSYVVEGELSHADSKGNKEALSRGCIQYMSAGRGIAHSEFNESNNKMLRFLQLWITPDTNNLTPQYGSKTYTFEDRHNKLLHVVTGFNNKNIDNTILIRLHQDANIFVSEIDAGNSVQFTLQRGRQAYLVCIEGSLELNNGATSTQLTQRDAVEIVSTSVQEDATIQIKSLPVDANDSSNATRGHLLMVEMAKQ